MDHRTASIVAPSRRTAGPPSPLASAGVALHFADLALRRGLRDIAEHPEWRENYAAAEADDDTIGRRGQDAASLSHPSDPHAVCAGETTVYSADNAVSVVAMAIHAMSVDRSSLPAMPVVYPGEPRRDPQALLTAAAFLHVAHVKLALAAWKESNEPLDGLARTIYFAADMLTNDMDRGREAASSCWAFSGGRSGPIYRWAARIVSQHAVGRRSTDAAGNDRSGRRLGAVRRNVHAAGR